MSKNNALKTNKKTTRGWPPERRKAQSARMKAAKIWIKSTGPKTPEGKAICAQNARKHGFHDAGYRALREAMRHYAKFLKLVRAIFKEAKLQQAGRGRCSARMSVGEILSCLANKEKKAPDIIVDTIKNPPSRLHSRKINENLVISIVK